MAREILVDTHVLDLAEFWLSDDDTTRQPKLHEKRVMSLAQDIQVAIESWCEDEARAAEEPRAKGADDGIEYADPRDRMEGRE